MQISYMKRVSLGLQTNTNFKTGVFEKGVKMVKMVKGALIKLFFKIYSLLR